MSTQVTMPKLGFAVAEARLVEWLVSQGDNVRQGQALYVVENEKAVQEIESPTSGRVNILVRAEETYTVGTVLAEID